MLDCDPIIHIGLKSIFKNSMIFEVCAYQDNKYLLIETITEKKIDFIISEIYLNKISVIDIFKVLKKNKINIPVVIFTKFMPLSKSILTVLFLV